MGIILSYLGMGIGAIANQLLGVDPWLWDPLCSGGYGISLSLPTYWLPSRITLSVRQPHPNYFWLELFALRGVFFLCGVELELWRVLCQPLDWSPVSIWIPSKPCRSASPPPYRRRIGNFDGNPFFFPFSPLAEVQRSC